MNSIVDIKGSNYILRGGGGGGGGGEEEEEEEERVHEIKG